jgi:hypothetical protein
MEMLVGMGDDALDLDGGLYLEEEDTTHPGRGMPDGPLLNLGSLVQAWPWSPAGGVARPSWARTRTLLIQRGHYNRLNSSNFNPSREFVSPDAGECWLGMLDLL